MISVLLAIVLLGLMSVLYSVFVLSGRISESERRRRVQRAYGLPCRLCGVVEMAHAWITGHAWSV